MTFNELGLDEKLLRAVAAEGYTTPTPIQQQAIPTLLEGGDFIGCAQTGTGKTAAFSLPLLQRLMRPASNDRKRPIRALIVAPTRELAIQISDSLTAYGRHTGLRNAVIFGGVSQGKQVEQLRRGVDILTATPGRLLDLQNQQELNLDTVEILVLDEADRMLDMGFLPDVKRIIARLPARRQTLLFSATMPPEVREIADKYLRNPVEITVDPPKERRGAIRESLYFAEKNDKTALLAALIHEHEVEKGLVFTRTKYGADKLAKKLSQSSINSGAIHGNKSQNARQRALEDFRNGRIHILVASDIAARGIDIDDITHVFNYELPEVAETYVHRIGRTGRAGATGIAISFCSNEERKYLTGIQKLIHKTIPVVDEHPDTSAFVHTAADERRPARNANNRRREPDNNGQDNNRDSRRDDSSGNGQNRRRKNNRSRSGNTAETGGQTDDRSNRRNETSGNEQSRNRNRDNAESGDRNNRRNEASGNEQSRNRNRDNAESGDRNNRRNGQNKNRNRRDEAAGNESNRDRRPAGNNGQNNERRRTNKRRGENDAIGQNGSHDRRGSGQPLNDNNRPAKPKGEPKTAKRPEKDAPDSSIKNWFDRWIKSW